MAAIALVTNSEGRVVDATEAAAPLSTAFNGGAHALIADMVSRARATGPICESFILGGTATYGLTILPLSDGGALVIGNETTLEQNLRDALIDSRQRYKDFVQCSSDFAWAHSLYNARSPLGMTYPIWMKSTFVDRFHSTPTPFIASRSRESPVVNRL